MLSGNGGKLIQCQGSSETFCVSREITILGAGSFSDHSSLRTLTFESPSRVKHLLRYGFFRCRALRFVIIPKSVCFIGEECFFQCRNLEEVVFESPATVQRIEYGAFSQCFSLISFTVPSSVSTLGNSVFCGCPELSSVTFDSPSQLTTIPDRLFDRCASLTTLTLPDSVTPISLSGVTSVIGPDWRTSAGLVMRLGTVFTCLGIPSSIRIPENVREIGEKALVDQTSLRNLSFEEGVLKVGVSAFDGCRNRDGGFPGIAHCD
jgi:hypothetical protein